MAVVQWFGAWYSIFVLSRLLPVPSLLSPVSFWLRPVVLCTTHAGCLLISTVVLCTIEAGTATDLPDPNVFRSRLPAFLSSSPSITSFVLLVPSVCVARRAQENWIFWEMSSPCLRLRRFVLSASTCFEPTFSFIAVERDAITASSLA